MQASIVAENISKQYFVKKRKPEALTLVEKLAGGFLKRSNDDSFWALKDVSFQLKQGGILGVIGRNGAGKSTLLKIFSRITPPTSGIATINGRVSSLLEVGTGFHPELTGRENLYLNGTLLGMKKDEVSRNLEQIVEFAEIGSFLDTPIKKYSSGMKVRLAFSVAAHLQAEILIVDEVLAVGDASFQQKCIGKMNEIARAGKTILMVSHNMSAIKNLCERTIYLKNGRKNMEGPSDEIVRAYLNENLSDNASIEEDEIKLKSEHVVTYAKPTFSLTRLSVTGINEELRKEFLSDENIEIRTELEVFNEIKGFEIIVSLVNEDNMAIFSCQLTDIQDKPDVLITKAGKYEAKCIIPKNMLGGNQYFVSVSVTNPSIEHLILSKAISFNVTYRKEDSIYIGNLAKAWIRPNIEWKFQQKKKTDIPTYRENKKSWINEPEMAI